MAKIELDVTLAEYSKAQNKLAALFSQLEMTGGKDENRSSLLERYRGLKRRVCEMRPRIKPEAGMVCTCIFYSDRSSGYVKKVLSPKKVLVQMNGVYHSQEVYTFRSNGHWVQQGTTSRDWGSLLALGYAENYYDRSF